VQQRVTCGGLVNDDFITHFTAEAVCERILKIVQYLHGEVRI